MYNYYGKFYVVSGVHYERPIVEVRHESWLKYFSVGLQLFGRLYDEFHPSVHLACGP